MLHSSKNESNIVQYIVKHIASSIKQNILLKFRITLNICPSVRYCSHAFRSGGCNSKERLAKYVASSKYC